MPVDRHGGDTVGVNAVQIATVLFVMLVDDCLDVRAVGSPYRYNFLARHVPRGVTRAVVRRDRSPWPQASGGCATACTISASAIGQSGHSKSGLKVGQSLVEV